MVSGDFVFWGSRLSWRGRDPPRAEQECDWWAGAAKRNEYDSRRPMTNDISSRNLILCFGCECVYECVISLQSSSDEQRDPISN